MPHLIANRPRLYDLTKTQPAAHDQFRWETINALAYNAGGVIFFVGSVLFFPALDHWSNLGAWLFVAGSLLYLVVNIHDAIEVTLHHRELRRQDEPTGLNLKIEKLKIEVVATGTYLVGSVLFIVGSLSFLSQIDWVHTGAWCFIVGSFLFVVGASVNILQILQAETFVTMQLMNLTAVTFVVGSVLFAVASIPYLWSFAAAADQRHVLDFVAAQFVLGSALFVVGGIINYWRAYLVIRRQLHASSAAD
jgi:YrhK-like protein